MKLIINLVILSILLFGGCSQNKQQENKEHELNSEIKRILIKQVEQGVDDTYGSLSYDKDDLNTAIGIINDSLIKKGYNFPDKDIFTSKIENIFGRTIDWNSNQDYLSVYLQNPCERAIKYGFDVQYGNILYVSKKQRIVTDFYALPELIDYAIYPEITKYEEEDIFVYDALEEANMRVARWKDLKIDLIKERSYNLNLVYHRNMYLFHDDQKSLIWLIENGDNLFLENLVKNFGYVQEEKLLKWILDKNKFYYNYKENNLDDFTRILANRKCNGKLKFNTQVLNFMKVNINEEYSSQIREFIRFYGTENNESDFTSTFSFSEKAMCLAYILYWCSEISQLEDYSFYSLETIGAFYKWCPDRDKYDAEFEKQNYYNLPRFEKYWEEAKFYGDGMTNYQDMIID